MQWIVLRESLWMVAARLAAGIPVTLALTKLIKQALQGIKANDPVSFCSGG